MYSHICNADSLFAAYYEARKCKRYKHSILRFNYFLESNIYKLQRELIQGYYVPSPYLYFTVSDPKERDIAAPAFRDRVVQHALVDYIEPLFDK